MYLTLLYINILISTTTSFVLKPHIKNKIKLFSSPLEYNEQVINTNNKTSFYKFGTNPRLEFPNEQGQLTWYPIGFSSDFGIKPTKVTIRDVNYAVWRDKNTYYGIRDCCSHQGSSFLLGDVCKNTITCPYHGYMFDGATGELMDIPKLQYAESQNHNIDCFKVVNKGDVIYFNTVPIRNNDMREKVSEDLIFVEPEFYNPAQKYVKLSENFEHYAKFVSVNSLDICHIGFVHTFGNKKQPNPQKYSNIMKINQMGTHYKIIYNYMAGENSLVNKIYNYTNIVVENEYILPHSTVARVKFGPFSSTIITHALPISKFKTKLFVKAYRSYWYTNLKEYNNNLILYPFLYIINELGDYITLRTMVETLKQDKSIVDFIDKLDYKSMHGKFSIVYDMFSNHYKRLYKYLYESGENIF
jgi:phenylpropionate dioxygenase-like ring-hydroxylating dioxygenase large terminal subunit